LEVHFYTSNIDKFLQARLLFERSGIVLRHFRAHTEPYSENYSLGKDGLLRKAIDEVAQRVSAETLFFVEDTSLRIEALSRGNDDLPGLTVKEWFPQTTFQDLDALLLSEGNDRRAVIKSDIALHVPGLARPLYFHGETLGVVADSRSDQKSSRRYPWLAPDTFNGWFVPDGAVRRLSDMDFEMSLEYDFRAKALEALIDRLEEFAAVLNLPAPAYRRRPSPRDSSQVPLFPGRRQPIVAIGRTCAGKTTLAEYAVLELNFRHIEASGIIRLFQDEAGGDGGQNALDSAQQLLEERGPDFVARQILRFYEPVLRDGAIVTGFRTIEELLTICEALEGAVVVWVEASERTRFERHLARGRYGDATTIEAFRNLDEGQMSLGLLRAAQDLADLVLMNEDSLEDYHDRVRQLLSGSSLSDLTGVRRLPTFAKRRARSQLYRCLKILSTEPALTSHEISERTGMESLENQTKIATRNVNQVLKQYPELARRREPPGEEIMYEILPSGRAYVRFLEKREQTTGLGTKPSLLL